jgi:Flp pilus assembly pilin Flp
VKAFHSGRFPRIGEIHPKVSSRRVICRNSTYRMHAHPAASQSLTKEVNSLIEYLSRLIADLKEESGQTMAEYAVVLGVITIAVVVTLGLLSTKISAVLSSVITAM